MPDSASSESGGGTSSELSRGARRLLDAQREFETASNFVDNLKKNNGTKQGVMAIDTLRRAYDVLYNEFHCAGESVHDELREHNCSVGLPKTSPVVSMKSTSRLSEFVGSDAAASLSAYAHLLPTMSRSRTHVYRISVSISLTGRKNSREDDKHIVHRERDSPVFRDQKKALRYAATTAAINERDVLKGVEPKEKDVSKYEKRLKTSYDKLRGKNDATVAKVHFQCAPQRRMHVHVLKTSLL